MYPQNNFPGTQPQKENTTPVNNLVTPASTPTGRKNKVKTFAIIISLILLMAILVLVIITKNQADAVAKDYVKTANLQLRQLVYEENDETRKDLNKSHQPVKQVFMGSVFSSKYRRVANNLEKDVAGIFTRSGEDLSAKGADKKFRDEISNDLSFNLSLSSASINPVSSFTDADIEQAMVGRLDRFTEIDDLVKKIDGFKTITARVDYKDFKEYVKAFKETQVFGIREYIDRVGQSKRWNDQRLKDYQKQPLINGGYNQATYADKIAENKARWNEVTGKSLNMIKQFEDQLYDEAVGFLADARRDKLNSDIIEVRAELRKFLND